MNREDYIKDITEYLSRVDSKIRLRNAIDLYDLNIIAEQFFCGLLNAIYDFSLVNKNASVRHAPAVDLEDREHGVYVQVTSNNERNKIVETIDGFTKENNRGVFSKLIVLIIGKRKKKYHQFIVPSDIQLEIWDMDDLIREINSFENTVDIKTVRDYLISEFENDKSRSAEPLGSSGSEKEIPTEGAFSLSHPFQYFGHEDEINEVLGWIGTHKIIIVNGEGGIGKTEFCREVLERVSKKMPDCTVIAVSLRECRDFGQFIRRAAGALGIAVSADDTPERIESLVLGRLGEIRGILYLDNFEDVMSETNTEKSERRRILDFLRKCLCSVPVTVLISSRNKVKSDIAVKEHDLGVLDDAAAVSLFEEAGGCKADERVRDFVRNDLYNYPLAIVLTAKHMEYVSGIDELKEQWKKARRSLSVEGMSYSRHESVEIALSFTYEEVKRYENARQLWAMFTLFPETVEISVSNSIIQDCYSARVRLIDLSVIHRDGDRLSMLPLLREYIRETDEYRGDLAVLSERLLEYYSGVFCVDRSTDMGSDEDLKAVRSLSDALYFMGCMADENNADAVASLHVLLRDYYIEMPYEAIEVVLRTAERIRFEDEGIKANIFEYLGDLERRTAKLEEAEEHYREAEVLYKRIHADLGLANVLKAMGELDVRGARVDEAGRRNREAEMLYRSIHADLGLANVLKAMGDLEMRTDKLEEAEKHYREAEELYRSIHDDLGLANVLKAMGDLERRKAKLEEAEEHYREAEELYRSIHYDLGLANVLQAMGDLEMRKAKLEEAEKHYREAERLYRHIHDDLGLANVLQAMGDLERRTDKLEEAEKHYREAEMLYRRTHADLGLANVLKAMGDLERRTAKLEEAEKHYREAEELYRRIHDELGLANVLQTMGDLEQGKGQFGKAIGYYEDAANLYEKTRDKVGLAYSSAELCYCYAKEGNESKTIFYAQQVVEICENLPYKDVVGYCMLQIMRAFEKLK